MHFYQELTIVETPEIPLYFIWSKVYTQVHLALVEQQCPDKMVKIGVNFPHYRYFKKEGTSFGSLGNKLRIFAYTKDDLQNLDMEKWLDHLRDYVHIKSIQPVPEKIKGHVIVKRYRADTNLERLTRRLAKRKKISFEDAKLMQNQRFAREHNISLAEAHKHYLKPNVQEFPFIKLKSFSSNRDFSLQIQQVEVDFKNNGVFSTYGTSSQYTVPFW